MRNVKQYKNNKKGMTLTEVMVVIGIIAVLVAIAIPSIIAIRKSLQFKKMNDYAKEVFLAAQNTLVERNAAGTLNVLRADASGLLPAGAAAVPEVDNALFPTDDWSDEYCYTTTGTAAFELLLPAGSIDETVRSQHILIEYNPYTGNVYSVFYSESYDLNYSNVYRDKTNCRRVMQGYYNGSGLSGQEALRDLTSPVVDLSTKGQEAILKVSVPIPDNYLASAQTFADAMKVSAKIEGEYFGGEIIISEQDFENTNSKTVVTGNTVEISFVLDSLVDRGSFASLAQNNPSNAGARNLGGIQSTADFNIQPGDNVAITASIQFVGLPDALIYSDVTVSGLNPMFGALQKVTTGGVDRFELYLENGRHLQNLNAISPKIASLVKSVYFSEDIYWNETQDYYTDKYDGTDGAKDGTYTNGSTELPGRGLPYFVPVTSPNLFGSAYFANAKTGNFPFVGKIINLPMLTDTDKVDKEGAEIFGGKHKVLYLNIDASRTDIRNSDYYVYRDENNNAIPNVGADRFTGLLSYCESNISSLYVVNSTIVGTNAAGTSATGGMVGACGPYAFLYDCGTYIDTADKYFSRANMSGYGVTGHNAVGGLVGYAKAHKAVDGNLMTNNEDVLAFSQCFAAVPVTGEMVDSTITTNAYGYTNGIGGIVGVSILTNFYNCYASGDVYGSGAYTPGDLTQIIASLIDDVNGIWSRGIGGFVGTSHGTNYKNCFVTGDVGGTSKNLWGINRNGVGGFIGVAFLDEKFTYGTGNNTQTVAQSTLFSSCYCTGVSTVDNTPTENFCGRILRMTQDKDDLQSILDNIFSEITHISAGNYYTIGTYNIYDPIFNSIVVAHYTLKDYIYKDSYYLNQYVDVSEDRNSQSNLCAQVVQYQDLQNLQTYQHNLSEQAKNYTITGNSLNQQAMGFMKAKYADYLTGFNSNDWGSATSSSTHPYSLGIGTTYPFTMLKGMDYYGDWPSYLPNLGLGYYEAYKNSTGEVSKGYYLDRDRTSSLRNGPEDDGIYDVIGDGYVILCTGTVNSIKINGNTYTRPVDTGYLRNPYSYTIGNVKYTAYELTPVAMKIAADTVGAGEFYSKLEITTSRNGNYGADGTFTVYFNPRFAITQVNPTTAGSGGGQAWDAVKPSSLPAQINIRTARQLRELGLASDYWGEEYHYVQLLDIDAKPYKWSDYVALGGAQEAVFRPIGNNTDNGDYVFNGSYNGSAGYVESAQISNVDIYPGTGLNEFGLFGVIGEQGSVSSITVNVEKTPTLAAPVYHMGMVAGINRGTLSKVTVVAEKDFTVEAPASGAISNFGMLAGTNNGTITDCTLVSPKTIKANVSRFMGGLVGVNATAEGKDAKPAAIENCTLTIHTIENTSTSGQNYVGGFVGFASGALGGISNLEVTNVTSRSGAAGGVIGYAENLSVSGVNVTVKEGITGQTLAGGFAAEIKWADHSAVCDLQQCNVTLSGSVSAPSGTAAGFAAVSEVAVMECNVLCEGEKTTITGTNAAGFVGSGYLVRNCTFSGPVMAILIKEIDANGVEKIVNTTKITGVAEIIGTERAAGFANQIATAEGNLVSPVRKDGESLAYSFLAGSNENLKISAPNAAGFVNTVPVGAVVRQNAALGTISGTNAAGFVGSNNGTVSACMANVEISGGTGFAAENSGTVEACYVWYAGENVANSFVSANTGTVNGCYAAPLGAIAPFAPEGGTFTNCYNVCQDEAESTVDGIVNVSFEGMAVLTPSALGGKDLGWTSSNIARKYPYDEALSGSTPYVFPMLLKVPQYGNWKNGPVYAYGVMYYEYYDDSLHYQIVDLSDLDKTVEEKTLTQNDLIDNAADLAVTKSGYAVFYRSSVQITVTQGDTQIALGSAQDLPKPAGFENYTFKIISEDASCVANGVADTSAPLIQVTGANSAYGDSAQINPYFACAITVVPGTAEETAAYAEGDGYHVHTARQLQNVAGFPGSSFTVCRNLDMSGIGSFVTIDNFSGSITAANNAVVSKLTGNSMFGSVTGTVSGLTLNDFNAAGLTTALSGKLENLSITNFNKADGARTDASLLGSVAEGATVQNITLNGFKGANLADTMAGAMNTLKATDIICTGSMMNTVTGEVQSLSVTRFNGSSLVNTMAGSITGLQATDINCEGSMMVTVTGSITPVDNETVNVIENFTGKSAVFGTVNGGTISGTTLRNPVVTYPDVTAADTTDSVVGLFANTITDGAIAHCKILAKEGENSVLSVAQLAKQDEAFAVGILAGKVVRSTIENVAIENIGLSVTLVSPIVEPEDPTESTDPANPTDPTEAPADDTEPSPIECAQAIGGAVGIADEATNITSLTLTGTDAACILPVSLTAVAQQSETPDTTDTPEEPTLVPLTVDLDMGGLVGYSAGTLANSTVAYQYITANDSSLSNLTLNGNYGGIVGRMTGGIMNNCHAGKYVAQEDGSTQFVRNTLKVNAGSTDNVNSTTNVGGAVGLAEPKPVADADPERGKYNASSAAVTITAGSENVGQFVGYIDSGEFTSCSGWEPNASHRFLGGIASTTVPLVDDHYTYTGSAADQEDTIYDVLDTVNNTYANFSLAAANAELTHYDAVLEHCYFQDSDGGAHRQYIDEDRPYYTLTGTTETGLYTGAKLSVGNRAPLSIDEIRKKIDGWTNSLKEIPGYYITVDDRYQQAYAWRSWSGLYYYYYVGHITSDNDNYIWRGRNNSSSNTCNELYTFSPEDLVKDSKYLILSGDTALTAGGEFETFTGDATAGFRDDTANPKFVLTATGENQLTLGGQTCTVVSSTQGYTVTIGDTPYAVQVYTLSDPTDTQTTGTFVRAEAYRQDVTFDAEANADVTSPDRVPKEVQAAAMLQTPVSPETEPTEEPVTEPTKSETEPATEPTEPTKPETEPATEPTEPTKPETEPATEPAESETAPTDPTNELTEPEVAPTEVVAEPPKPEETSPATEPEEDSPEPDNS